MEGQSTALKSKDNSIVIENPVDLEVTGKQLASVGTSSRYVADASDSNQSRKISL